MKGVFTSWHYRCVWACLLALMIPSSLAWRVEFDKCGVSYEYWSDSCGPIGSAVSRHCSRGGTLVNERSCATHFQPGSRGCGVLNMGCCSLCRIEEPPCERGKITFPISHQRLCLRALNSTRHVPVFLSRVDGSHGTVMANVSVTAFAADNTELQLETSLSFRVTWNNGDEMPKKVSLQVPSSARRLELSLASFDPLDVNNATIDLECQDGQETSPWTVYPCSHMLHVAETEQEAIISICRNSSDPKGPASPASVNVVLLAATASHGVDYVLPEPRRRHLHWKADETEPKTLHIRIRRRQPEAPPDTLYFTLANVTGARLSQQALPFTLVIDPVPTQTHSDDDDNTTLVCTNTTCINETQQSLGRLKLMPWLDNIDDAHWRSLLVNSWTEVPVKAGETIYEFGRPVTFLFIIKSGKFKSSLELFGKTWHFRPQPGELFGALAATGGSAGQRVQATSDGEILAMDFQILTRLHNHAMARQNLDIMINLRKLALRQMVRDRERKFPIALFPGFMSARLEAWKFKDCRGSDIHVRDQVWLSFEKIMHTVVVDEKCWLGCLQLGEKEADPDDCKVRAMDGIGAISELSSELRGITTIFHSLIESLAMTWGYDINSIIPVPYDWRLSPDMLERRDGFFSRLKRRIEMAVELNGLPTVFIAHSLGNNVIQHFVKWLNETMPDSHEDWLDRHVIAYYGIAAPLLGASSSLNAIFQGDPMGLPLSKFQSRKLGSTFGSAPWMLPVHDLIARNGSVESDELDKYKLLLRHDIDELELDGNANFTQFVKEIDTAKINDSSVTTGWQDTLLTLKFSSGVNKSFGVDSLSNSTVFETAAREANDSLSASQHHVLQSSYFGLPNQALNPLSHRPFRPPIKHVAMLYGVNLPTPYRYDFEQVFDAAEYFAKRVVKEHPKGVLADEYGNVVGKTPMRASGDGTVNYVSLSWAHAWHESSNVTFHHKPRRVVEFFDHLLGRWGEQHVFSVMNTVESEVDTFFSEKDGRKTWVIEMTGEDHREVVRSPIAFSQIHKLLEHLVEESLFYHPVQPLP